MAASPRMRESPAYRLLNQCCEPITRGYDWLWQGKRLSHAEKAWMVFAHWREKARWKQR